MKKILLLSALAIGFGVSAQTVQNIPGAIRIDGEYSDITVAEANMPVPDPETGVTPELKPRLKQDDAGIWQFDNMCDKDKATFKLNVTEESCFIMKYQTGTKNNGVKLQFEILNAAGDVEWSGESDIWNNGQWNSKWVDAETYITDPLTTGEKTFTITFLGDPDINGNKNTVNIREISFEAREEIVSYSLYTDIVPGPEAGSLVINPARNAYLEGTEVTITAQANAGYKFNHFENGYGDIINENPYTLVMTESTDMIAVFEEVQMYSFVPGFVNFDTRTTGQGKPETKAVSLDGEPYNDGEPVMYLANYRDKQSEVFELDVKKDATYTIEAPTSTKESQAKITFDIYDKDAYEADPTGATPEFNYVLNVESTGNWQKFKSNSIPGCTLTTGRKMLRLYFTEDAKNKYTANLLYINFVDPAGIGSVEVDEAAEGEVRYYNLQGIEVPADTKGLLLKSNGEKVMNR